ncbi:MAG: helix-turn-helix domain-containing protein, partial [Nanoarchaeota archaeon]|nr:helix-turn-helix domain-containing protein [Nanoarchaeota archaeon]
MAEIDILEDLGLSEAEAKVYLALLETGSTLAGPIIKKTGLHRGTTYQILQRLIEKGLVSYVIKAGKRY